MPARPTTFASLLSQCRALSDSFDLLSSYLATDQAEQDESLPRIELRPFQRLLRAEQKGLERIAARETAAATAAEAAAAVVAQDESTSSQVEHLSHGTAQQPRLHRDSASTATSDLDSDSDGASGRHGDADQGSAGRAALHAVRSSNLPYLEAVWEAALSSRNLVAIHRRVTVDGPPDDEGRARVDKRRRRKAGNSQLDRKEGLEVPPPAPMLQQRQYTASDRTSGPRGSARKKTALVDVVAEDGALWIKVSTVSEKRLLFDRAKAGMYSGSEDENEDSDEAAGYVDSDGEYHGHGSSNGRARNEDGDGIKIQAMSGSAGSITPKDGSKVSLLATGHNSSFLHHRSSSPSASSTSTSDSSGEEHTLPRMARHLQRAALRKWVRYQHPRVVFIVPNIPSEGTANTATKSVLKQIRRTGATVLCADDLPAHASVPDLNDRANIDRLLPSAHPPLTEHLNLDCTTLLALISDVSHIRIDAGSHRHATINHQIARESERPLLPHILYPALRGRSLHAAQAAVARMQEIVDTIGTESERQRAALLVSGWSSSSAATKPVRPSPATAPENVPGHSALLQHWTGLSIHATPADLNLPVQIEPDPPNNSAEGGSPSSFASLPAYAEHVCAEAYLSPLNRAVWWLGWARGWVTVSSNRTVARLVEMGVQRALERMEQGQGREQSSGAQKIPQRSRDDGQPDAPKDGVDRGPCVWLIGTARSLLMKERGLRG